MINDLKEIIEEISAELDKGELSQEEVLRDFVEEIFEEGFEQGQSSDPHLMNRLGNASNPYQDKNKKVLCVCSAGLLRSPTTAVVLSQEPFNFNTRAAGLVPDYALVPVDEVLLYWADEIVCMTQDQAEEIEGMLQLLKRYPGSNVETKKITCLGISDSFMYRDPKLVEMIKQKYEESQNEE